MILEVFIEFFEVKIAIGWSKNHYDLILTIEFDFSQNIQYISNISAILPIYLRYLLIFTNIFPEISARARMRYTLDISPKY